MNFFLQVSTNDKKVLGDLFKRLVRDCYNISRVCNTSYTDVLQMSLLEKYYILQFIEEDNKELKKQWEDNKLKMDF